METSEVAVEALPAVDASRSEQYDRYAGAGGVFPEQVYSKIIKLSEEALELLRQRKLRFIGGELSLLRTYKSQSGETRVVTQDPMVFFEARRQQAQGLARQAARRGEAWNAAGSPFDLQAFPDDIQRAVILYCIMRENTRDVLKSRAEDSIPGTSEKTWSDQRIFAEALLMSGDLDRFSRFVRKQPQYFQDRIFKTNPAVGAGFVSNEEEAEETARTRMASPLQK